MCLQGIAQSGQLHCIFRSVHLSGKILIPQFLAIDVISGASSLFNSLEIMPGCLMSSFISVSIWLGENGGIVIVTLYGVILLPVTLAVMMLFFSIMFLTFPLRA